MGRAGGVRDLQNSEAVDKGGLTFFPCFLCVELPAFQVGEGRHSGNDSEAPPEPAAGTDDR